MTDKATTKEKAIELVEKFHGITKKTGSSLHNLQAVECAILAAEEIYLIHAYGNPYWSEVILELKSMT